MPTSRTIHGIAFDLVAGRVPASPTGNPLHPIEGYLVTLTAIHICLLPWAFGAMHPWTQGTSLVLSALGFGLAVYPRNASDASGLTQMDRSQTARKLRRFPVFWAGLALMAYVGLQGLNPAWHFASDSTSWWLVPRAHVQWLPSGVDGPYSRSNAWRSLTVYASVWLLVCSVWAGFSRRQSYRILFTLLVGNAALLAVVGVLQQLIATNKIFWLYLPSNPSFIASFIYRNHAGAYFNLMVALGAGLALWHYERVRRRREGPGVAIAFVFSAAFLGIMVLFSYSLASIALLLVFTAIVTGFLILRLSGLSAGTTERPNLVPAGVAVASFVAVGLLGLRTDVIWKRFSGVVQDPVASMSDRAEVRKASIEMLNDRWLLGWGAGAFRYGFPIYAKKYPDIYLSSNGRTRYWEYAHDDLIEFPLELGIIGVLPIVFAIGYFTRQLFRNKFWLNDVSLCAAIGCSLALVHAWVDFVFQNPAVLLTWGVLITGAARWAELDQSVVRRMAGTAASLGSNRTP